MKIIIGISNFSFSTSHFKSFKELEQQFINLKTLQGNYDQHGVSLSLATDILNNKWPGLSVNEQVSNFSYGKDKQMIIAFRSILHRKYLSGFKKDYTTSELELLASNQPDTSKLLSGILYLPALSLPGHQSFDKKKSFEEYYEFILGHYPVDNESFYKRATSHFTNIMYQSESETTLDRVDDDFINYSIAFTQCLKALNDSSPTNTLTFPKTLNDIATKAKFKCTQEGNSHKNFKFEFTYNKIEIPALDCQFHLKPSEKNKKGDGSHNHKRLYFGFFPINENEWIIAVSAIGPHITTHNDDDRYAPLKVKRKKVRRKGNS